MATASGGRATYESGGSGEEFCTSPIRPDINEEPLNVSRDAGQNVVEEQIGSPVKLPKIPMASRTHPATMEDLPDDLLKNIFIRLFSKQIAQMRSVSKPWNALLSKSSFVKSHLHHSIHNNNQILLVFYNNVCTSDFKPFTAHPSRSPDIELTEFNKLPPVNPRSRRANTIRIIGAANGLICSSYGNSIIHIWNPSLNAVSTLPRYPTTYYSSYEVNFRFGFDPVNDDYKVVKLIGDTRRVTSGPDIGNIRKEWMKIGVYSMRKGSWELITQRFPSHIIKIFDGDYVSLDGHDGLLHWLGRHTKGNKDSKMIVAFDLSSYTFREIPVPDSVTNDHQTVLGVLARTLCVMSRINIAACEVWVMEEYGVAESWVKRHVFSQFNTFADPYGFTSQAEFLVENNHGRLVLYDPLADETKIFENFCSKKRHRPQKFVEYVDSLVWIEPDQEN